MRVVDPEVQTRLEVFFLIDPNLLEVDPFDILSAPPAGFARIDAVEDDSTVAIAALSWDQVPDAQGALRTVLVIDTEEPGGFQIYRLTLVDDHAPSRIDPFFNAVEFSFKQGCPSDFDCKPRHDCPEEALVDWPVDYLARDFESLRNALLEFSAQRYPDWQERIPADVGAMIAELMAALGDELSYVQDRYAREGYLETLSQRRSLAEFARLVDYQLDEGLSPRTWLQLTVQKVEDDDETPQHVGMTVVAGSRVWADLEGQTPIAFEVGNGLRSYREIPEAGLSQETYWLHSLWNDLRAHVPDPTDALSRGGRARVVGDGGGGRAAQGGHAAGHARPRGGAGLLDRAQAADRDAADRAGRAAAPPPGRDRRAGRGRAGPAGHRRGWRSDYGDSPALARRGRFAVRARPHGDVRQRQPRACDCRAYGARSRRDRQPATGPSGAPDHGRARWPLRPGCRRARHHPPAQPAAQRRVRSRLAVCRGPAAARRLRVARDSDRGGAARRRAAGKLRRRRAVVVPARDPARRRTRPRLHRGARHVARGDLVRPPGPAHRPRRLRRERGHDRTLR